MKRSLLVATAALSLLSGLLIGPAAAQAAPGTCLPKGAKTTWHKSGVHAYDCDLAPATKAVAAAKTPKAPGCGSKSGETFLRTGSLRGYTRMVTLDHGAGPVTSPQEYVCSSKYHRSVALALCEFSHECFTIEPMYHWTGRFLIYLYTNVSGTYTSGETIYIVDLKTGRNNIRKPIPKPGIQNDSRCAGYACDAFAMRLVGAKGTSYAYSYAVGTTAYAPAIPEVYRVIETHCVAADLTDRAVVVGHPATDDEARSLRIRGRTIHWRENGLPHSAPLCPSD